MTDPTHSTPYTGEDARRDLDAVQDFGIDGGQGSPKARLTAYIESLEAATKPEFDGVMMNEDEYARLEAATTHTVNTPEACEPATAERSQAPSGDVAAALANMRGACDIAKREHPVLTYELDRALAILTAEVEATARLREENEVYERKITRHIEEYAALDDPAFVRVPRAVLEEELVGDDGFCEHTDGRRSLARELLRTYGAQ